MRLALTVSLIALAALVLPASVLAAGTPILVQLAPGVSSAERADVRDDAGVERLRGTSLPRTELVQASDTTPSAALRRLNRDRDVAWAAPDVSFRAAAAAPNDALFGDQWSLQSDSDVDIDAPEAWLASTGVGVNVAVVDTGIQVNHPDLAGAVVAGHDYVDGDANPADANGHGTHVSGIIAARRNNLIGIAGISPGSRIIPLRALDATGNGSLSDILQAFDDAGRSGARVVSASLGSDPYDPVVLASAPDIRAAFNSVMSSHPTALYVVAAGNDGNDNDDPAHPTFPCNATVANLLCVGASDSDDTPAFYSNYGASTVDLFAPGSDIESTWIGSGYRPDSGTSMATPLVSGVAALVLSRDGALTTAGLRSAVLSTVESTGGPFDGLAATGGRLNAAAALASVPPDHDGDGVRDSADACPAQAGRRLDGCPDRDGDGVLDSVDRCPTAPGPVNGCPRSVVTPPPTKPKVIPDRDGDGRSDSADACPTERAVTADGCPIPQMRSVKVSKRAHHKVKVRVVADRLATVAFTLERRVCNSRGRKCRWKRAAKHSGVTSRGAATYSSRALRKGRYRVTVRLSSSAGRAKLSRMSFRI